MILYTTKDVNEIVLQFGTGLIGNSIFRLFINKDLFDSHKIVQSDWINVNYHISTICEELKNISCHSNTKLTIIWSAGKVGFRSNITECLNEYEAFKKIFLSLKKISDSSFSQVKVLLFSSAGGLYEAQINIEKSSPLTIKRPYGEIKYKQEEFIKKIFPNSYIILRPSSVYSTYTKNSRKGLILSLLMNGISNKESTIYASQYTLRDYILDDDIANFVYELILYNPQKDSYFNQFGLVHLLFSGRPYSILEVVSKIEYILMRRIPVKYLFNMSNNENITFNINSLPHNFYPSSLKVSLHKLKKELIN